MSTVQAVQLPVTNVPRRRLVTQPAPQAPTVAPQEQSEDQHNVQHEEAHADELFDAQQSEPVQEAVAQPAPRRRGRPPKNATAQAVAPAAEPKKRGRKPGSKNKPAPQKADKSVVRHDLAVLGGVFVNAKAAGLTVEQYIDKHRQEIAAYDAVAPKL